MSKHTQMVRRLMKSGAEILATLNPAKVHLAHVSFGFIGEWHELATEESPENHLEELGDMWNYLTATALGLDVDHAEAIQIIIQEDKSFTDELFKLHDLVKKYIFYNDVSYYSQIQKKTYLCIALFREKVVDAGFTMEQVEAHNINKLTGPGGRYEGGVYSDEMAKLRKDKVISN